MNKYDKIPPEKFEFVQRDSKIYDKKFETKPIGYFKDAMIRFSKNRTNVIATSILFVIILCTIIIPVVSTRNYEDLEEGKDADEDMKEEVSAETTHLQERFKKLANIIK